MYYKFLYYKFFSKITYLPTKEYKKDFLGDKTNVIYLFTAN